MMLRSFGGAVPRFGELEAAIMDEVWSMGRPVMVRDVVERLEPVRGSAYTTVQTVMEILYRKGWLTREKDGRAYRYLPSANREDYTASLMNEALSTAEDRSAALTRFVESMEPGEAADLRRALDEAKEAS
jgi:predicted transcriptional regulator